MNSKVVITGMGIVSRLGENFPEVIANLNEDRGNQSLSGGAVYEDFDHVKHLGKKNTRNLNRCTKMMLAAGKLALEDAGIAIHPEYEEDIGVILASNYGVDANLREMERILCADGVVGINPGTSYYASINGVTSQMSVRMKAKAFNITMPSGWSSGIDAVSFAKNLITTGSAGAVMVCGAEEAPKELIDDFNRQGLLAEDSAASRPFRSESQGMILGDGAAVIILEGLERALSRNANIFAEVGECGLTYYHEPGAMPAKYIKEALEKLIKRSGANPKDIDLIMSSANGSVLDIAELRAYSELFNGDVSVFNVKSFFGECFGFTSILQVAFGAYLLRRNDIKRGASLTSIESGSFDLYEERFDRPFSNALINSVGLDGNACALLLKPFKS
ncbi:MAG: hypothetical protein LBL35_02850 [Clostridiales bacterium]|jgi:3-oxoacyl-(acyl-carrier-protein) synthase|nr:hypothetical protein [Clostridiales bacterium]